ncbi:hypothetical protein [Nereida sp. NH-UV-3]|uniref:hypothetical protein n=1 Tax=Nereida TaxID=282198 RepID=UPI0036F25FF2
MKLMKLLAACCIVALSACVDQPVSVSKAQGQASKNKELSASEGRLLAEAKSLSRQSRDIVARNAIEGAVIGAAAGCALSLLLGGDADDCKDGAIVGGVAGGAVGYGAGKEAAQANKKLVEQKQVIAKISGINQKLGSIESRLRSVVRQQNAELSSLRRQVSAGQISESIYKARARGVNSNRRAVRAALQNTSGQVNGAYKNLVALEKDGAGNLSRSKAAATSTRNRLNRTVQSIDFISVR